MVDKEASTRVTLALMAKCVGQAAGDCGGKMVGGDAVAWLKVVHLEHLFEGIFQLYCKLLGLITWGQP